MIIFTAISFCGPHAPHRKASLRNSVAFSAYHHFNLFYPYPGYRQMFAGARHEFCATATGAVPIAITLIPIPAPRRNKKRSESAKIFLLNVGGFAARRRRERYPGTRTIMRFYAIHRAQFDIRPTYGFAFY